MRKLDKDVTILVAGHRKERLERRDCDVEAVRRRLLGLFKALAQAATQAFPHSIYRADARPEIRVLTGAADGVDEMVASLVAELQQQGSGTGTETARFALHLLVPDGVPKAGQRQPVEKIFIEPHSVRNALLPGRLDAFLGNLAAVNPRGMWRKAFSPWLAPSSDFELSEAFPKKINQLFDVVDVSAQVAAAWHRDSIWVLYLLSFLAVFAAVAGSLGLWGGGDYWGYAELFILFLVIIVTIRIRRSGRHQLWLRLRFLAEQCRFACLGHAFLAPLAIFRRPVVVVADAPEGPEGSEAGRDVRVENSELWLLQRVFRSQGLPACRNAPFVATEHRDTAGDFARKLIKDQIAYHEKNHARLHRAHHNLHTASTALFLITFAAAFAHVVWHPQWVLIVTASFPALAAAIHGILTKQEMARVAAKSADTARQLRGFVQAIEDETEAAGDDKAERWLRLRQIVADAAETMSAENQEWLTLIGAQKPELPA